MFTVDVWFNRCVGKNYDPCADDPSSRKECVGQEHTNFVYVVENSNQGELLNRLKPKCFPNLKGWKLRKGSVKCYSVLFH